VIDRILIGIDVKVFSRVETWIIRWRRHWHSAFDPRTRELFPGLSRRHRDGLMRMLRHPIRSSER